MRSREELKALLNESIKGYHSLFGENPAKLVIKDILQERLLIAKKDFLKSSIGAVKNEELRTIIDLLSPNGDLYGQAVGLDEEKGKEIPTLSRGAGAIQPATKGGRGARPRKQQVQP